jgi:hypothetical protein
MATIRMTTTGGPQLTLCLMVSAAPLFLTGIELGRVRDPQAAKYLRASLDESHVVLAEQFGISKCRDLQFLFLNVAEVHYGARKTIYS